MAHVRRQRRERVKVAGMRVYWHGKDALSAQPARDANNSNSVGKRGDVARMTGRRATKGGTVTGGGAGARGMGGRRAGWQVQVGGVDGGKGHGKAEWF